ncbi:MAG: MBL fold metallo-hydrolase, partial [Acetobacteraceae bacterium]
FSEREYAYWTDRHAKEPIGPIEDSVLPVVAAKQVDFITSDHVLDDQVRLMPTPGHTPDHFAVLLGRGGKDAVLTGDLIHSPLQARYPEMSMFADYDPKQAAVTRRNFLETMCEAGTLCCTAHFPSPSKCRFNRWGEGFRCDFA